MKFLKWFLSALFPFLFSSKLKPSSKDSEINYRPPQKAVKRKPERFFYRNAGFNRKQQNELIHARRKARSKAEKLFITTLLESSPKNIPYRRGFLIHPQHAGQATPENLIYR